MEEFEESRLGGEYVSVVPLSAKSGFCRINLAARPATLSRSDELEIFKTAMAQTTVHGKILCECNSPIELEPECLADIFHFYKLSQLWTEIGGGPAITFLSPAPIVPLILETLGIRFSSI